MAPGEIKTQLKRLHDRLADLQDVTFANASQAGGAAWLPAAQSLRDAVNQLEQLERAMRRGPR